jgi:hypothetical protein
VDPKLRVVRTSLAPICCRSVQGGQSRQCTRQIFPSLAPMQEVYQGPTFKDIIGAAVGIASGSAAGALEINHPGALCWGAGLPDGDPLKSVTPDFVIGDKVCVSCV